ncbi:MAG: GNAT family N-acetyltransferase [Chloroflexi bacterium]|nr:GNAT family N-acetyltransferase [Chloroflexota bacterium]
MQLEQDQAEQPIVNITGQKVALGPLRRDLIPIYLRWMNDFEVTYPLAVETRPLTLEAEEEWYDRARKNERDAYFTIYERATLRPVGNTVLHNVDHLHEVAEFGLMIGEKDCWGKGYGTEATTLMLDYAFTALSLHSILLRVDGFNERAIRTYSRAGFREVGRWREAARLAGQAYDVIFMDCLATEFQNWLLPRIFGIEKPGKKGPGSGRISGRTSSTKEPGHLG